MITAGYLCNKVSYFVKPSKSIFNVDTTLEALCLEISHCDNNRSGPGKESDLSCDMIMKGCLRHGKKKGSREKLKDFLSKKREKSNLVKNIWECNVRSVEVILGGHIGKMLEL